MHGNTILDKLTTNSCVPDQQWEILRIEQLDFGDATLRDDPKFAPKNVDETGEDEYIRDECSCAKLGQISDEGQR